MRISFFSLICILLIISCKEKEQPVTNNEALQLSKAIDSAIRYKKPIYFNSLFDIDAFAVRIAKEGDFKISRSMLDGVKDGLSKSELGDNIIRAVSDNGSYELVHHYEKDNIHHLLFRMWSTGGMNYHDFELVKRKGKVGISDIYIFLTGENLSKTLADLLIILKPENNNDSEKKLEQIKQAKKVKELMNNGQYLDAKAEYTKLPSQFKEQKSIQLMNILLLSELDEASYAEAIEKYRNSFPNEPNLYLVLVDGYIIKKDYASAIAAIDKVDSMLNKDPFLDYLRGLMYNLDNQKIKARQYLEQLHKNMPEFDDGALELIANYIDSGETEKAKQLIKEYKANKSYDQEMLNNYLLLKPGYSDE